MVKLANSVECVQNNINEYWETAHQHPDLIKDAARVKKWKAYRTNKGEWRFGPSRFVGYNEMTADKYVKRKKRGADGGLNGTETEAHLRKWTENVPSGSRLYHQLHDALADFLAEVPLKVGSGASFSLLTVESSGYDLDPLGSTDDEAEVDALVTLSKRLNSVQLQKLMRRLEALGR